MSRFISAMVSSLKSTLVKGSMGGCIIPLMSTIRSPSAFVMSFTP